jgi:hypothetical protein
MKKHTQLFLITTATLLSMGFSACNVKKNQTSADTNAMTHREKNSFRLLLPLFKKEEPLQACFYETSWKKDQHSIYEQKAARVNRYSVSLSDLVDTPNALAGFGVTGGLAASITVTVLCLGPTAGLGGPLCFAAGGAILAASAAGVSAASKNAEKWDKTFSTRKPEWVSNKAIDDLLPVLIQKGENGGIDCPKWEDFSPETRASAWENALKIAEE